MVSYLWENLFKKDADEKNIARFLSQVFLFQDLNIRELKFLKKVVHIRNYHMGEAVFKQGELGVGMYIIVKGLVDITVENVNSIDDKKNIHITQLESGDFFGEIALVEENGRRTANAVATTESILIGFFKPDLKETVSRNPSMGVKIYSRLSQILGKRLKETANKVSEIKKGLN